MKKQILPLFLFPLFVSCYGGNITNLTSTSNPSTSLSSTISSFSSSSPSSTSSSSTSTQTALTEEERIVEALKEIKNTSNYTLSYLYNNASYKSYYTKHYLYFEETNLGYMELESYDKELGESLVYNFYFDSKDTFTLAYPNENIVTNCDSFNYLASLKAIPTSFKEDNGSYYSENKNLIKAFAYTLGYYEDADNGLFTRVRLSSDNTGEVFFALQIIDTSSFTYVDVPNASGTIENISSTIIEDCENYYSENYTLSETYLSEEMLESLNLIDDDVLSVDTKVYICTDNDESLSMSLSYDREKNRVHIFDEEESFYSSIEDKLYQEGIDAQNNVSSIYLGDSYSFEKEYPFVTSILRNEKEAFRLDDSNYCYYGFKGEEIYKSFSYVDINSIPEKLTLSFDEQITMTALFPELMVQENGETVHFKIKVVSTVVEDRKIPFLTPYPDANPELSDMISALNGDSDFIAHAYDTRTQEREKNTSLVDDLLLFETKNLTFSGTVSSYTTGYKQEEDGVQRFLIDEKGVAKKNGPLKEGKFLTDFVGMDVSINIFQKENTSTYTLKPLVLKSCSSSFILGNEGNNLVPSSLKMMTEGGKIAQISYDYDDGLFQQGSEIVEYQYDNLHIDSSIIEKVNSMPDFVEPENWKDENEEIYNQLVDLFDEEIANSIPYLYDEETYGQFESIYLYNTLTISSDSESVDHDNFYREYKEKLLTSGFVLDLEPDLPGAEIYTKDNIEIRLAKNLIGGLFITNLSGI